MTGILSIKWIEKRHVLSFFLGIIFTTIGFFTALLLFKQIAGIATIFFTALFAIPTINALFDKEEKIETNVKHPFFQRHEEIIDIFLYFFLGTFLVFLVIGIFSINNLFGGNLEGTNVMSTTSSTQSNFPSLPPPDFEVTKNDAKMDFSNYWSLIFSIFRNNLYVMIVAFSLSLLYGVGSIFVLVYNASIFAYGILSIILRKAGDSIVKISPVYSLCNLGVILFHLIPEVGAYLLSAIAGGVLSKAILKEKPFSPNFWNIFKDSIILLFISIFLLIDAAFIEVVISNKLIAKDACQNTQWFIILITLFLVIVVLSLEFIRLKSKKQRMLSLKY